MAFLLSFISQQLLFLFSKHLDTMSIQRIVSPVKQIFGIRNQIHHQTTLEEQLEFIYNQDPLPEPQFIALPALQTKKDLLVIHN